MQPIRLCTLEIEKNYQTYINMFIESFIQYLYACFDIFNIIILLKNLHIDFKTLLFKPLKDKPIPKTVCYEHKDQSKIVNLLMSTLVTQHNFDGFIINKTFIILTENIKLSLPS